MISQLPRWVEFGAFILALVAGFINAVGILSFQHQSLSHLSGSATQLGIHLLDPFSFGVVHLVGILLSFLLGSCLAGFLLSGLSLQLGRHYDTALFIEGILLFLSFYLLYQGSFYGFFLASSACGLQNALATKYSGAVIRTTHVTGLFTDLGIMLGSVLRGETLDKRKAKLYLLIIVGFIAGGSLGAWLYQIYQFKAMLLPSLICFLIAAAYRFYLKEDGTNN